MDYPIERLLATEAKLRETAQKVNRVDRDFCHLCPFYFVEGDV